MNIKVSYAEMESAATALGAGRDEITAKLAVMESQIRNLISSGFVTSMASGKFATAFEGYCTGARTVADQLTEIQTFLRQTSQTMQDMDAQIAARIG
ncbi:WXG100 family type VII secretion target [Canibacter sp. lx-72]|uniref:WXG100 family type VII secretion target n=1 Tax=Canibacter zhuwentaonis TaxID=2837491 RepID=UPI001BDC8E46|nr:WXG100 family type VII secretion target [Canibacter zhuwentaonis]MBT1017740.1 WXG100 family type VII secretion target [Canibacter zhuwentaonis]MBT1034896.1 WXG100 family type VII secretion target [Canibacter zhuwentaonis]